VAAGALVATGVVAPEAGARPALPAAPAAPATAARAAAPAEAPHPAALPALPRDSAYAIQVLRALNPEVTEPATADIRRVGGAVASEGAMVAVGGEVTSHRWLDPRIDELYQRFLDRPVDPSGLEHWWGVAVGGFGPASGADLERAAATIGGSAEAYRRAGGSTIGFVDATFRAVLGRAPDPSGEAWWRNKLEHGTPRTAFVDALLRSRERAGSLVGETYVRYLGRAADAAGRRYWAARYHDGRVGELRLIATFLAGTEARRGGCDPLDPRHCLLPFPNDWFTVPDSSTATGRRVSMKPEWLPANKSGVHPDPTELNRNDGFSVGQAALVKVPGIDLAETGAAPLTDIGASLDDDAPIVVVDADTGERHPIFTELDANVPAAQQAADQLLIIRPAVNYLAGHRYIVALRNLRDGAGKPIPAGPAFAAYRDGDTAGIGLGTAEARRPHMERIFEELDAAGIERDDLYLAWDFTVASAENTTGRMLSIRDRALATLGGGAPDFTVTTVTEHPRDGVDRRVEGTFQVPLYLTGTGAPGSRFQTGADGLPVRNGTYTASFDCELPVAGPQPARVVIYGHGLFGDRTEVQSRSQAEMVGGHNMAYCATDWVGMSESDIGNAATILKDVSTFDTLADRSQQGILDTIFLGRLLTTPDGLASAPAFRTAGDQPRIDTSDLFYDGNSQGSVVGGAFVAVSPDVSAAVLGVPGMNYSTLLERSVDFDPFSALMKDNYPDTVGRVLGLGLIQMLWDRAETNGYAAHLTDDPLPGTQAKRVLLHVALGDHQVAPLSAEVEARTAGMAVHRPAYGPGRTADVDPVWGLPSIDYPSTGSGLIIWDTGSPLAPIANVPPRAGHDPHEDPRRSPDAQAQKSEFLRTGGQIVDVCSGAPCTAPQV
jgi:hypothetical protein